MCFGPSRETLTCPSNKSRERKHVALILCCGSSEQIALVADICIMQVLAKFGGLLKSKLYTRAHEV